jgi:hypothetical protein
VDVWLARSVARPRNNLRLSVDAGCCAAFEMQWVAAAVSGNDHVHVVRAKSIYALRADVRLRGGP